MCISKELCVTYTRNTKKPFCFQKLRKLVIRKRKKGTRCMALHFHNHSLSYVHCPAPASIIMLASKTLSLDRSSLLKMSFFSNRWVQLRMFHVKLAASHHRFFRKNEDHELTKITHHQRFPSEHRCGRTRWQKRPLQGSHDDFYRSFYSVDTIYIAYERQTQPFYLNKNKTWYHSGTEPQSWYQADETEKRHHLDFQSFQYQLGSTQKMTV